MSDIKMSEVVQGVPISWQELKYEAASHRSEVDRLRAQKGNAYYFDYMYRGQSSSSWGLKSSLERYFDTNLLDEKEISFDKYASIISELIPAINSLQMENFRFSRNFKEGNYEEFFSRKNMRFLLWLRHCGFPSPFIDWTKSLYVAAYFAYSGSKGEEDVAIYSYQHPSICGGCFQDGIIENIGSLVETHHRHHRQQATYTYVKKRVSSTEPWVFSSHEMAIKADGRRYNFKKYILAGADKSEVLRELEVMNINEYTLFGTSDALVKKLAYQKFVIDRWAYR